MSGADVGAAEIAACLLKCEKHAPLYVWLNAGAADRGTDSLATYLPGYTVASTAAVFSARSLRRKKAGWFTSSSATPAAKRPATEAPGPPRVVPSARADILLRGLRAGAEPLDLFFRMTLQLYLYPPMSGLVMRARVNCWLIMHLVRGSWQRR